MKRPKHIVIEGLAFGAIGQIMLGAVLITGIEIGDQKLITLAAWPLIGWPFAVVASTIMAAHRAWRGEPPNDAIDGSLPMLSVLALLFAAALLIH